MLSNTDEWNVHGRLHRNKAASREVGPSWFKRESHDELRKLYGAVSQVAVTGRVPAVLGRDASLSSSPSSNPPKRRVWGTPMPYVSKFSGRSLSSVLPDAIKQVRRIPKQAQHKRNRLRQQSPSRSVQTLRSLITHINTNDARDRVLQNRMPSAVMEGVKTRLSTLHDGMQARSGKAAIPRKRGTGRALTRKPSSSSRGIASGRPKTPPMTTDILPTSHYPADASFSAATPADAHAARALRRPSTVATPLPVRAIQRPVRGVYISAHTKVSLPQEQSNAAVSQRLEAAGVEHHKAHIEAALEQKRLARAEAYKSLQSRERRVRAHSDAAIPSATMPVAEHGTVRGGPGMITGSAVVRHEFMGGAIALAKKFGLVLSNCGDGPVYVVRLMLRPRDYEPFVLALARCTNGNYEFVTGAGLGAHGASGFGSPTAASSTRETSSEDEHEYPPESLQYWGPPTKRWSGDVSQVDVNAVVDTLGQKKARHEVAQAQDDVNWRLMDAAVDGDIAAVRKCVDTGISAGVGAVVKAAVDFIAPTTYMTPLLAAAQGGHVHVVKFLLKRGADRKRKNLRGKDALHLALESVRAASAAVLSGKHGAARRRERAAQTVQALDDRTIFACAQDGDLRRLRHLVLTQGVKVNRANKYGMTPLHFAVQSGNVEVAEFLANNGGDPHRRNNLRQSPFDIARTFGDQKAAELTTVLEQATILKQSEADTLAAMRKTERLQANRKINRKMRQFTRGTAAAVHVFAKFENPHDQLNDRPTQPRRWMKASEQSTVAIAQGYRQAGGAGSTVHLPDSVTNSTARHARRLQGAVQGRGNGSPAALVVPATPPPVETTQFEQWVRLKFGDVDEAAKASSPSLNTDTEVMSAPRSKAAVISALRELCRETFYPRPQAVIKALLSARVPHDDGSGGEDRLLHSMDDARGVWEKERFQIITAFRLLRDRYAAAVKAAYQTLVPEHVRNSAKPSLIYEWFSSRGFGEGRHAATWFKDLCLMVFVDKGNRHTVGTQAAYHELVSASQEAFIMKELLSLVQEDGAARGPVSQEQHSKQFEAHRKEAEKRRRLEQREDRLAASRQQLKAKRKAEREEEARGGLGPKAQAALDSVNTRMDGIENTLTTLLFEVQSQTRARKFFSASRR